MEVPKTNGQASMHSQVVGETCGTLVVAGRSAKRRICQWVCILAFAAVLFAAVTGVAYAKFGSLGLTARYLNGERLILHSNELTLGKGLVGEVHELSVQLTNYGGTDAVIIGSGVDCTCMATDRFPMTVAAGETVDLHITLKLGLRLGDFDHTVTYYTDSEHLPVFRVSVQGHVAE